MAAGPQRLSSLTSSPSRQQDGLLGTAKHLSDHDPRIPVDDAWHVGARPDQVDQSLGRRALSTVNHQDLNDIGQLDRGKPCFGRGEEISATLPATATGTKLRSMKEEHGGAIQPERRASASCFRLSVRSR